MAAYNKFLESPGITLSPKHRLRGYYHREIEERVLKIRMLFPVYTKLILTDFPG